MWRTVLPFDEEIGGTLVPVNVPSVQRLKEVTLKPIVYQWTFEQRVTTLEKLLHDGFDVKVVVTPERKQGSAKELSSRLLDRIADRVVPYAATEQSRNQEGPNWVMVLTPTD